MGNLLEDRPMLTQVLKVLVSVAVTLIVKEFVLDATNTPAGLTRAMSWILSIMAGYLVFGSSQVLAMRKDNKEMVDKIHRDLVRTNAIIPNLERKLAITAEVFEDFPDEREFGPQPSESTTQRESIDIIRMFAYQNLILTPQYLNYLFHRVGEDFPRKRVVVIEEVCQATLAYLFLSICSGHQTYIIGNDKFKRFIEAHCNGRRRFSGTIFRKMIKGNPLMLKSSTTGGVPDYFGRYTDFRRNREVKEIEPRSLAPCWELLQELAKAARPLQKENVYHIREVKRILEQDARRGFGAPRSSNNNKPEPGG